MLARLEEYKASLNTQKADDIEPYYQNNYIGELQKRDTTLNDNLSDITTMRHKIQELMAFNNRLHDDVKKRALECFLETAKIAMRGRTKKFNYILPDYSKQIVEIDGDEFAECDYGLVVSNSRGVQELQQKLETLAQAAL